MLQWAHDLAAAAEQEQEKGRKRPKTYTGNSVRTKEQCRQRGCELATKGFDSVKAWLLQMPAPSTSCETTACNTPESERLDLCEESEESASEDEIQTIRIEQPRGSTTQRQLRQQKIITAVLETDSESESQTVVGSHASGVELAKNSETLDPKEKEKLCCMDNN